MVAVINVFYRGNEDEKTFIEALVKHDFVHYVDSVRFNDFNWLQSNTQKGYIYHYHGGVTQLPKDTTIIEGPGVFVLIVDCLETNPYFYKDIEEFISACFDGSVGKDLTKYYTLLDMFPAQKEKLPERKIEKRSRDDESNFVSTDYTFEYKKFEDFDCIFYQLTKPNTDRPYVVLVQNFSKHGHKRLFTSMRLFDSWGASKYDVAFLYQLWTYLEGGDKPDFDEMLKEHVEAVLYGEAEPNVWRSDLDTVSENYIRKLEKPFRK
jgi:hypothetical protein